MVKNLTLLTIITASSLLAVGTCRADQTVQLSSLDLSPATQGWGTPHADQSVEGNPITLDGTVYQHGFGTHATSLLTIDLHGAAALFTATVGVDDEVTSGRGSVVFQVLGPDHSVIWQSGLLKAGDPVQKASVPLTGLSTISLHVTDGGDGTSYDHADWADAAIVTTGALPQTIQTPRTDPVICSQPDAGAPVLHGPTTVGILPGTPLLWTLPVTGDHPIEYSSKRLPRGLHLDLSTGTITGSISRPGDYAVTLTASNSIGKAVESVHFVAGSSPALTPPMGWNSYDCFGDSVTEQEVLANAQYVHDKLQPYGWDTVVVDYRWYDPGAHDNNANARAGAALTMDRYGRLLPSTNRFPSAADGNGFKPLAAEVHAMGLKFGIHIMRGIPRNAVTANLPIEGSSYHAADAADETDDCPWCQDMYGVKASTPAGIAYYNSIVRLYASWGVDYIKMDDTSRPYHTADITAVSNALRSSGRSIVYSLSPGETPIADGTDVASHANLWRMSDDFWDSWAPLLYAFTLDDRWRGFAGPGHWPDADMLPLGHLSIHNRSVDQDRYTNFTKAEQVTLLSLWSLYPSPLMVGANLPDNDSWTLSLLTNPEVLALDQDVTNAPASRISHDDQWEVWSRQLSSSSIAVGIFNKDDFDNSYGLSPSGLNLTGKYDVRDLWQRKDLGDVDGTLTINVPSHGAILLKLTKE